jgi:hypothetical protein
MQGSQITFLLAFFTTLHLPLVLQKQQQRAIITLFRCMR